MGDVRFDDKVAIVTGAGGGLGRAHALLLASRGCKVVVNDLGGSRDGVGAGSEMADKVVQEIKDAGGEAVANYDGVDTFEGGANIVKTAIDNYGRIDIVVNNAGILRDKSFVKMDEEAWDLVYKVHVKGAYNVTKHAWPYMKENGYGRIVMTASAAGIFGNFGQTNYGSAKTALIGFMNVLKIEGAKYNIKVNTIAPIAGSRLTEDIMPPDFLEKLKPEFVSVLVAYLCSENCQETGGIYSVGGGFFGRIAVMEGPGAKLPISKEMTIEDIESNFDAINNLEGAKYFANLNEEMGQVLSNLNS